eukprot:CAMPEP_0202688360 /NCGR_PEP_ID=MMETSP1385-20130828/3883_1 /ASSEMBLY_ACC=CAM_ASM_000861 /TAXON_ID=933848 /ORGANISM="Elphidium margaritaceum" /LENGTH=181 /DNA_ID=CAMNT_0049343313 /DNA_START=10 /DNA_END=555 /DNA_ORIENTATION=+
MTGASFLLWTSLSYALTYALRATPDTVASAVLYEQVNLTVQISLYFDANEVEIVFQGPNEYFHGIGFDGVEMNGTYAILVVGASTELQERQLGLNAPGALLKPSIQVVSNTVSNNVRTVNVRRNMTGLNDEYYSFQRQANQELNIIYCYGTTPSIQYHGPQRNRTSIYFSPPSQQAKGYPQ